MNIANFLSGISFLMGCFLCYYLDMKKIISNHEPVFIDFDQNRKSVVLIPLTKKEDEWHIVFEVRASSISQPGDVSFPGGAAEKGESLLETAVRETTEELGLKDKDIDVWGQCDTYWTGKNRIIYSFAGEIPFTKIHPNSAEVESIFTVPLDYLLKTEPKVYRTSVSEIPDEDFPYEKIHGGRKYRWMKAKKKVLFYEYDGHVIWGITAKILNAFIKVVKDETENI